jgi:aspartate racemase
VDQSVTKAARLAGIDGKVGILASPAVRRIGLFDAPFGKFGVQPIFPRDEVATLAAIRQIKASGPGPEAQATLQKASEELLSRGAEVQMIACTEFSLIPGATARGATAFDTLDVLVAAIVDFALAKGEKTGMQASHAG